MSKFNSAASLFREEPRVSGTWIDLDSGDSGETVDEGNVVAESWESANHDVEREIEWTVETDDGSDDDYISISRELFNKLLVLRNTCTCGAGE